MGPEEGLLGHFLGLAALPSIRTRHPRTPDAGTVITSSSKGSGLAGAQPVKEARRVACLHLSHGKTIPGREVPA